MTNSQVQQAVLNYLNRAGLPGGSATVTVNDLTNPGTDCTRASQNDQLQVTVTMPFTAVRWTSATLVTKSSTQLAGTAIWFSTAAQPYPSSVSVPQGY